MKKSIVPTIVLGCVLLTVPAFAKNSDTVNNQYREQIIEYTDKEDKEIIPYSMVITTGSYRGIEYEKYCQLTKGNGSKVNFWIRNNGRYPVVIKINGRYPVVIKINGGKAVTVKAGGQGYTSTSVGRFSKDYKFTASCPQGGDINIDYRIVQRD